MVNDELTKQIDNLKNVCNDCEDNTFFTVDLFEHFGTKYLRIDSTVLNSTHSINIEKISYITVYDNNSATIMFHDDNYFHFNWIEKRISSII